MSGGVSLPMVSGSRINLVVTTYISNPNPGPLESM